MFQSFFNANVKQKNTKHFPGLRINNKDKVKDNNYRYDLVRKSEIRQTAFIAQENFSAKGKVSLNIDASILASGAYHYSLMIDGRLIAPKQMA